MVNPSNAAIRTPVNTNAAYRGRFRRRRGEPRRQPGSRYWHLGRHTAVGAAQNRAVPLAHPHQDPRLALVAVAKQRPQRNEHHARNVVTGTRWTARQPARRQAPRSPSRQRSPSRKRSPSHATSPPQRRVRIPVADAGLSLSKLLRARRDSPSSRRGSGARPPLAQHDRDPPQLPQRSPREHRQRNHRHHTPANGSPDQHLYPRQSRRDSHRTGPHHHPDRSHGTRPKRPQRAPDRQPQYALSRNGHQRAHK